MNELVSATLKIRERQRKLVGGRIEVLLITGNRSVQLLAVKFCGC